MYRVQYVDDDKMPAGHDFVMAEDEDGNVLLFLRQGAGSSPATLEDAWAAYRLLAGQPRPTRQRLLRAAV